MNSSAVAGFVAALTVVALIIFAGVAITEIGYVADHPYRYGPAKVIAWSAGGGAVLSLAVAILAVRLGRSQS